jgi:iron complex transport system substrate-binding protein
MTNRNSYQIQVLVLAIVASLLLPAVAGAAPLAQDVSQQCATEYVTQADDWLSKLSEKYLGDPMAFPAIVAATNLKHTESSEYAKIGNPDEIEIGWKLCIPNAEDAERLLASEAAAANSPTTVSADALGRTVKFDTPPQRIVTVGKAFFMISDALFLFPEAKDRVVAMGSNNQQATDFLTLVDPTYNDMEFLAFDSGPEQIAAVRPDVVIVKSFAAESLGDPIERLGIPTVYVDLETPEQYVRDVRTLGQVFGNTQRAEEILAYYQARSDAIAEQIASLEAEDKPTVLMLQYSDKGGEVAFNVPPAGWIQTTMAEMAGGTPVWTEASQGGGWAIVNFEQIAAWNPDQIYVIAYTQDPSQIVADLKEDPNWQALKAVQNDQLFAFAKDTYSWDQPDTRWTLGQAWMAAQIHPRLFPDYDVTQDLFDFYSRMYGLDQQMVEANILPLLQGDVQ